MTHPFFGLRITSKCQWIFTKLGMCIDIVEIWFGIASGQIASFFDTMRVDSRELPLSAIPLCQLSPCHLGPPRSTLSLNLYVKSCLDCTIGAFHMSIPAEPSPSE